MYFGAVRAVHGAVFRDTRSGLIAHRYRVLIHSSTLRVVCCSSRRASLPPLW